MHKIADAGCRFSDGVLRLIVEIYKCWNIGKVEEMGVIINFLHSIAKSLPEVKNPDRSPSAKERLIWTGLALILFFIMYHVTAFGVRHQGAGFDFLQTITASRTGSLLTAGIGPIVLASIFLQLFVGAGLIKLDMQNKDDKKKFHEVQKVVAILLAFVEAAIFVVTSRGFIVDPNLAAAFPFLPALIILQVAMGSVIMLYLDEIVSKYGIGSGISLFIAAGVSFQIFSQLLFLIFGANGVVSSLVEGGATAIPDALLTLLPFLFTVIVFFVSVYAEGIKVEIPIAFERMRGFVPKLPLKYFYVSNIPVIFASALLLNVQLIAGGFLPKMTPDQAQNNFVAKYIGYVDPSSNQLSDGFLYFITPVLGARGGGGTVDHFNYLVNGKTSINHIPEWVHALTYILFLSFSSILFGIFWVETSNMDAKSVANQLTESGMQIPGFRRDPRMLESILNKHIFPLTVLGSFSVGLLASVADLTGALGTGTGILLTVSILYRMYEQMEQMKMFELYPTLGKIVGQ